MNVGRLLLVVTAAVALIPFGCSGDEDSTSSEEDQEEDELIYAPLPPDPPLPEEAVCVEELLCDGVPLPSSWHLNACCADADNNSCGLDVSPLWRFGFDVDTCMPLDAPGQDDERCPDSPVFDLPALGSFQMAGCCRQDNSCGFRADRLVVADVGLGCMDSSPFYSTGEAPACDAIGVGGNGGAGGAPMVEGGAGGATDD